MPTDSSAGEGRGSLVAPRSCQLPALQVLMNVEPAIVKVSLAVIVHHIPDFTPESYTQGDPGAFGGNQGNYRGLTSGRGKRRWGIQWRRSRMPRRRCWFGR